jgi:hypothetical protein
MSLAALVGVVAEVDGFRPARDSWFMGVICDYFAASSDGAAAAVIQDGPTGTFGVVDAKGVDPEVLMGQLQSLLTGVAYDIESSTSELVELREDGALVVVRMSESWQSALAMANHPAIVAAAGPWSECEEFWGGADPEELEYLVVDLVALAREAAGRGERVYCWICV